MLRSNIDSKRGFDAQQSNLPALRPSMVLVIGLYKSGTSLITKLVQAMGFEPLYDLWQDYVEGMRQSYLTYESAAVNQLNDSIIHRHGGRLHRPLFDWRFAGEGRWDEEKRNCETEILRILEFHVGFDTVIKDPRFCVTLPAWLPVLEKTWQPVLIWVKRQRSALVHSWFKDPWCREWLKLTSQHRAHDLAAQYEDHLERHVRTYAKRYPSHVVNLESFRCAPRKNASQLARFLDRRVNLDTVAELVKS